MYATHSLELDKLHTTSKIHRTTEVPLWTYTYYETKPNVEFKRVNGIQSFIENLNNGEVRSSRIWIYHQCMRPWRSILTLVYL